MAHYSTQEKPILNQKNLSKKLTKKLRTELAHLIKAFLKKCDQNTCSEIYKLFRSVDQIRDTIGKTEG